MLERRDSYRELYRDFRWNIPERFNIGVAVSDRWAWPSRTAPRSSTTGQTASPTG
jgi:acetyl-CoA synthetase